MIKTIKQNIKKCLEGYYLQEYAQEINIIVEEPKKPELGDISIPMFAVVKVLHKPLPELTKEAAEVLQSSLAIISDVNVMGAFVNVMLNKKEFSKKVVETILTNETSYGNSTYGKGKKVVLDYSSPNIAKSFSIGHLRSTMIGNSLKLILQKCGFETTSINYLGDWGTQFGKMIVAYKLWGDKDEIMKDPINQLTALYVRFHNEAVENPSLEDEAREVFRQLELGNAEYLELWRWIREESLKESAQIYDLLEVNFDSYNGEAYYNDKMDPVVEELEKKELLKEDQGAMIVSIGDDVPPALIKRADGGSLYITRDLAAVFLRKEEYNFDKILYVVGNEQKLHFEQLRRVIHEMGYSFDSDVEHIGFGLYLTNGKKMSTRSGKVVKLYDVLQQAIDMAYQAISTKNPTIENKDEIARRVGIAAIVFGDLKNHRELDVEFNLEASVQFEGQTGPYLQYTGVRIASILKDKQINLNTMNTLVYDKTHYFELIKLLANFTNIVERAAVERAPSIIAKYLLALAQGFNKFYSIEKINVEDDGIRNANFALAKSIRVVLNEGLRLLGIHYLEQM